MLDWKIIASRAINQIARVIKVTGNKVARAADQLLLEEIERKEAEKTVRCDETKAATRASMGIGSNLPRELIIGRQYRYTLQVEGIKHLTIATRKVGNFNAFSKQPGELMVEIMLFHTNQKDGTVKSTLKSLLDWKNNTPSNEIKLHVTGPERKMKLVMYDGVGNVFQVFLFHDIYPASCSICDFNYVTNETAYGLVTFAYKNVEVLDPGVDYPFNDDDF